MQPDSPFPLSLPADDAMLGAIVDTSGSVILGLRPDHTIFAWNRAAEQLYQTSRTQAIGMNYVETFLAPEHRTAVAEDIRQVLAGKKTSNFEDDSVLPDGSRRTLLWNVTRVLDDSGAPVGIVATGQDITERKEAEQRFRLVFEHASEGLLISDDHGVVDCNPAALRLLGLSNKEALLGRRPAEFSPALQPDGMPSAEKSCQMGEITRRQGAHVFDWIHQRPDGTDVPVEVSVRHAKLNGRRVSIVAWRDQSRRQELERERAAVEQRLHVARTMEAVGQLAGGVAHDFNNLLAALRNSIQLAIHEVPREFPIHADLEMALHMTERATGLTAQLLTFSRQPGRNVQRVDLTQVVLEMLPLLRTALPAGVTLHTSVHDTALPVPSDRVQLEQVLLNLVLNARDAMPSGGELTLSLHPDATGRQAVLSVIDTGTGMDAAVQARMFEPFFTTKPVGAGTGLGLSVVYGVVTHSGGTVQVESAPGQGTTMRVAMPLAVPGMATPVTPIPAARRSVVLLVDDDRAVRSTTRRLLDRSGFAVVEAESGDLALDAFVSDPTAFDVLLTDIRMPGVDGIQLAQAVRAAAPNFPVVFFSGFDEGGEHPLDAFASVQLVTKPFAADRLFSALRQAIAERPSPA